MQPNSALKELNREWLLMPHAVRSAHRLNAAEKGENYDRLPRRPVFGAERSVADRSLLEFVVFSGALAFVGFLVCVDALAFDGFADDFALVDFVDFFVGLDNPLDFLVTFAFAPRLIATCGNSAIACRGISYSRSSSIAYSSGFSAELTSESATPFSPARPVRPIRCT